METSTFIVHSKNNLVAVAVETEPAFRVVASRSLFKGPRIFGFTNRYVTTRDCQRFLFLVLVDTPCDDPHHRHRGTRPPSSVTDVRASQLYVTEAAKPIELHVTNRLGEHPHPYGKACPAYPMHARTRGGRRALRPCRDARWRWRRC